MTADAPASERRRHERLQSRELATSRLRLGTNDEVRLVDLSASGARIEARARLRPGAPVRLAFPELGQDVATRGRIVWASVFRVSANHGVTYRAAIHFDEPIRFVGEASAHRG
jgi:hypothetical protein